MYRSRDSIVLAHLGNQYPSLVLPARVLEVEAGVAGVVCPHLADELDVHVVHVDLLQGAVELDDGLVELLDVVDDARHDGVLLLLVRILHPERAHLGRLFSKDLGVCLSCRYLSGVRSGQLVEDSGNVWCPA